MADRLTIEVDTSRLIAALDAFPTAVAAHALEAGRVTIERIQAEAQRRVARATGATQRGIVIRSDVHHQPGWALLATREHPSISLHRMKRSGRIHTQKVTQSNVPIWLEFGTKHMLARPYFFASAKLEEGAHDRRMREAIRTAIEDTGFGDR